MLRFQHILLVATRWNQLKFRIYSSHKTSEIIVIKAQSSRIKRGALYAITYHSFSAYDASINDVLLQIKPADSLGFASMT